MKREVIYDDGTSETDRAEAKGWNDAIDKILSLLKTDRMAWTKELAEQAKRLRRSAPNLSMYDDIIVVPDDAVEYGKPFILMNRSEYWRHIKSIREKNLLESKSEEVTGG